MTRLDRLADRVSLWLFALLRGARTGSPSPCGQGSLSVVPHAGAGSGPQRSQCGDPHAVASPVAGSGQVRPGPAPPRADLTTPEEWRGRVRHVVGRVAAFDRARLGVDRRGCQGAAWPGGAWQGTARQGMAAKAGLGAAWHGKARQGEAVVAWRGVARRGGARRGSRGPAGRGAAWPGMARQSGHGLARPGTAGQGAARRGSRGPARRGPARRG